MQGLLNGLGFSKDIGQLIVNTITVKIKTENTLHIEFQDSYSSEGFDK